MSEAYKVVSEAAQRRKKQYDKRVCNIVLMPGDRVLVRNMSERDGPRKLRAYSEDEVCMLSSSRRIKTTQCTKWDHSQEQRKPECYTETCLPCAYLPLDESTLTEPHSGRGQQDKQKA